MASIQITMKMIRFVAILTIIVSCLGLLGIADYSAKIKTKEIGIRKVLGARGMQIVQFLSKEFMVIMFISVIIAIPLAFLLNQLTLQLYERHVSMSVDSFVIGSLLMLILGLGTVFTQTFKASMANPVDALKCE